MHSTSPCVKWKLVLPSDESSWQKGPGRGCQRADAKACSCKVAAHLVGPESSVAQVRTLCLDTGIAVLGY